MKKLIRLFKMTPEFKALREDARTAIEAYADGADFGYAVMRLGAVGAKMAVLLG